MAEVVKILSPTINQPSPFAKLSFYTYDATQRESDLPVAEKLHILRGVR